MPGKMFPITREALAKHDSELERAMSSIRIGGNQIGNLVQNLKGLKIDKAWTEADETLRNGFALYFELYDTLQKRIISEKLDQEISIDEQRKFMASYAAYGAASYIHSNLTRSLEGKPMDTVAFPESFSFGFGQNRDDVLNTTLAVYHNMTEFRKKTEVVKTGKDLVQSSIGYFKYLQEEAIKLKPTLNKKLVDLVATTDFRILDDYTLSGFEVKFTENQLTVKQDFALVQPHEVAGNVLAKKEMFRDMDRLALYDPILKKNPATELGGISWSVIYVGLPGTGKSTLFLAGWTRAKLRCEQVTDFWKTKNFDNLYFERISIDPKVKDKMYGGTAGKMAAADEQTADPSRLNLGLIDDIDLLMEGDRDSGNGGADNDILNGLMQILGGTDLSKRKRGNTQWWAATNAPTKMDPALLQRFGSRYEVDGPQEWFDFGDILLNKLSAFVKPGIDGKTIIEVPMGEGYKPFEMRKGQTGYEAVSNEDERFIDEALSNFKGGIKTFKDLGTLCAMYKKRNPRFTGRAVDSVSAAIKKRVNDYEIPETWFTNHNEFFAKDYEERVGILREKCKKVAAVDMAREIIRYAKIEESFAETKFNEDVKKEVHARKVIMAAMDQLARETKK